MMKMKTKKNLSKETLSAQALGWIEEYSRSIIPPIYPSTTFARNADLSYHEGRSYTRGDNPTYKQASELLSCLENGKKAQLFASGMAACVSIFQSLHPGDHVITTEGVYYGVQNWLNKYGKSWGILYTQIPDNDIAALNEFIISGKTRIVWIETPSNPLWNLIDISAFSETAHKNGAMVIVDNTVATPVLTRPLDFGADIVMHAATKYLNGHGDVLMGALITKAENEFWQRIIDLAHDAGPLPGSFETWLLLRGMRTLFLRMERICMNAQKVAEFLQSHPECSFVYYPGLKSFPGHKIAEKQMHGGFGGMISFRLKRGRSAAVEVQAKTKVFKRATSLGLTESLIEHRSSYEGPQTKVPDNLLRLSLGIENADDLINDLRNALDNIK